MHDIFFYKKSLLYKIPAKVLTSRRRERSNRNATGFSPAWLILSLVDIPNSLLVNTGTCCCQLACDSEKTVRQWQISRADNPGRAEKGKLHGKNDIYPLSILNSLDPWSRQRQWGKEDVKQNILFCSQRNKVHKLHWELSMDWKHVSFFFCLLIHFCQLEKSK